MKANHLTLKLDPKWVLSRAASGKSTIIEDIVSIISKKYSDAVVVTLQKEFHACSIIIASDTEITSRDINMLLAIEVPDIDGAKLSLDLKNVEKDKLTELLNNAPKPLDETQQAFFKENFDIAFKNNSESKSVAESHGAAAPEEQKPGLVLEELIGFEPLKNWINETKNVAKTFGSLMAQTAVINNVVYLISINRGNGFTSIMEMMSRTLEETGLIKFSGDTKYMEVKIPYEDNQNGNFPFLSEFEKQVLMQGYRGIVAFDIEEWIDHLTDRRIDKLLSIVWEYRHSVLFVFKIPFVEKSVLEGVYDRIDDVISVRAMKFVPPSDKEYFIYFSNFFKCYGIDVNVNAYNKFILKVADEKNDGKFYGYNTIRKFANEMLYRIIADSAKENTQIPTEITAEHFEKIYVMDTIDELSGFEQLDSMVALNEVKERIREILASAKLQKSLFEQGTSSERACYHMMFTGNPGTGKTVVARIVGRIFREEGLLSIGNFFEVSRKDFIGRFVGHTAPKTMEICRSAYGSVLFIDEAYTLANDHDGYSEEAIGTLIAEMENHRDDMIVIFAGYEKELEALFDLNPGLKDRIPYKIDFPNYNRNELKEIFYMKLNKKIKRTSEFEQKVDEFFTTLPDSVLSDRNFSNGRFVRNLAERIMSKAALRIEMSEDSLDGFELTATDFVVAAGDKDFYRLVNKVKHGKTVIGF